VVPGLATRFVACQGNLRQVPCRAGLPGAGVALAGGLGHLGRLVGVGSGAFAWPGPPQLRKSRSA